jgi:salicylate hydroxylase
LRDRFGDTAPPRFRWRVAWRALVPADAVAAEWRAPAVRLWLGKGAHLVHYPVKRGAMINIVAIVHDDRERPGWSEAGDAAEIADRFVPAQWTSTARDLVGTPERWQTWALYDRPATQRAGSGAATLIGDAAHPMLPFLAQGAAMAIEDAGVLADCLARMPDDATAAMRRYESLRRARTAKTVRAARRTGATYQLTGAAGAARNLLLRRMGGEGLLARQRWLYDWRP